jgi:cytochrome c
MKQFCIAAALLLLAGCQQSSTPNTAAQPSAPSATQTVPAPASPPATSSATAQPAAAAKPGEAVQPPATTPAPGAAPSAPVATRQPSPAPVAPKPAAPTTPSEPAATAGDAAKGKLIAGKCAACHNFTAKKKVGPGWGKGDTGNGMQPGIFGREAGTSPGFKYKFTEYIKPGMGWKWDEVHIRAWDCNSAKAIREFTGDPNAMTRMPPQNVCDKADQDDLIAFMKTL